MEVINYDEKKKQKKYNLMEFLPPPPFRMLISAPSGGGKSNLLVNLFNVPKGYKSVFKPANIVIFSSTMGLDDKLNFIKANNRYSEFKENVVLEIIEQQKTIIMNKAISKRLAPVLLIFDDMASEGIFKNDRMMKALAYKSRHYNISFIILTQKYNEVATALRRNANSIFLFEPRNRSELDIIVEENIQKSKKKEFERFLIELFKEPYSFLQINYIPKMPKYVKNLNEEISFE